MTKKPDPRQTVRDLISWVQMYNTAHPELEFMDFVDTCFNFIINAAGLLDDKEEALDAMNLCAKRFKMMIEIYQSGDYK